MNDLITFDFNGSTLDYAILNGEPLFNLNYVGGLLGIVNPRTSIDTTDVDYVVKLDDSVVGLTYNRNLNNRGELFLTEAGLYRLIGKSDKPIAEKFQKWVNKEVLPSIRKTGSYSINKSPIERILSNSKDQLEAVEAIKEVLLIEKKKQELITKERDDARDLVRDVVQDNTTYTATEIAKDLCLRSAIELNKWLVDIGFMYKHGKSYLPYAEFSKMGLTSHKLYDTGNVFNVKTVKFTNLGKMWIVEKWKELHKTSKICCFF